MPQHLTPAKSGVHRVACIALYRALLRQSTRVPLGQDYQLTIARLIRSRCRSNAKIQSPPRIVAALELGYKSLKTLHYASSEPKQALPRLLGSLTQLHLRRGFRRLVSLSASRTKSNVQRKGPIVWPRPNTPVVLSRPFPSLSGRRHIPKLVNTNGIAHLRFKKPQSPFLSRVNRDLIRQREARFNRLQALEQEIAVAQAEDEWDGILESTCGFREQRMTSWASVLVRESYEIKEQLRKRHLKNTEVARKMFGIVEKEKALAEEERRGKENEEE